jgi:hypothetical protein
VKGDFDVGHEHEGIPDRGAWQSPDLKKWQAQRIDGNNAGPAISKLSIDAKRK